MPDVAISCRNLHSILRVQDNALHSGRFPRLASKPRNDTGSCEVQNRGKTVIDSLHSAYLCAMI